MTLLIKYVFDDPDVYLVDNIIEEVMDDCMHSLQRPKYTIENNLKSVRGRTSEEETYFKITVRFKK